MSRPGLADDRRYGAKLSALPGVRRGPALSDVQELRLGVPIVLDLNLRVVV